MRLSEDSMAAVERRRNQIRVVLFLIILFTLPFYPLGVWLWLSAPDSEAQAALTQAPTETIPPLDNTATEPPETNTPRPSSTPADPLDPTPIQIVPLPTSQLPATAFIPPTSTVGPTLTAAPTNTLLPTFTPMPPSNTPLPSSTPLPTSTPIPTATPLPPPSDTPAPPPAEAPPEVTAEAGP